MGYDIHYEALIAIDFITATDQTAQLDNSIPLSAISIDFHMGTNKKIYFGASDKHYIYSDDTDLYITSDSGDVQISGSVYAATHMHFGNGDEVMFGDGDDWRLVTNATSPVDHFELKEGAVPALIFFGSTTVGQGFKALTNVDGNDIYIGTQSALDNNKRGGDVIWELGAKHGSGRDGVYTIKAGSLGIWDQAGTANTSITVDAALTTALTGTIATGSALTNGLTLATAAGDVAVGTNTAGNNFRVRATEGADSVLNGDFASDLSDWTAGAGWSWSAGTALHTAGNVATLYPAVSLAPTAGNSYKIAFTVSGRTAGSITMTFGGVLGTVRDADGTYTAYVVASSTGNLIFTPTTDFDGALDDVSVKLISNGTCTVEGLSTASGRIILENGSAYAPALVFSTDSYKLGIYRHGAAVIGFSDNGNLRHHFTNALHRIPSDTGALELGATDYFKVHRTATEARMDFGTSITAGLALSWVGVDGLKIDDATITDYKALTNVDGKDVFIRTQSALDNDKRGGNLAIEMGREHGSGVQGILSVNGPVTMTPATAVEGLVIDQDNDADGLKIDSEATSKPGLRITGKYNIYATQDVTNGYGAWFYRNLNEVGASPLVFIEDDHTAVTQHCLSVQSDSSTATTAAAQLLRNGITTTSTDALLIENSTAALVGETVEMSGRIRFRAHAWKSDAVAASQTQDFIIENLPATGTASTTATLRFGHSDNGAGFTYPLTLTSSGVMTVSNYIRAATAVYSDAFYLRNAGSPVDTAIGSFIESIGNADTMTMASGPGNVIVIGQHSHLAKNYDHADQTDPTIFIHSATDPDSPNTQWISFAHNQVDGVITTGLGGLILQNRAFTATDSAIECFTGEHTNGDGTTLVGVHINPKYTQGATTAAATDLLVSRWENSVGSGAQLLADFGTTTDGTYASHTSLFSVDNSGRVANKILNFNDGADLTIAAGSVTATNSFHRIVVQGGAGSGADDLDTIVAGNDGDVIVIAPKTSGANDTVTAKDGAGNLVTAGDFAMDHVNDRLTLMYSTADSGWVELSRSSNA
jgi:hypothetical protein